MRVPTDKVSFTKHTQESSQTPKEQKKDKVASNIFSVHNTSVSLKEKLKLPNISSVELSLPKKISELISSKKENNISKAVTNIKNNTNSVSLLKNDCYTSNIEDKASKIISECMRRNVINSAYTNMLTKSDKYNIMTDKPDVNGFEEMKQISRKNLTNLREDLFKLSNKEMAFLDSVLSVKLRATHASDTALVNENNIVTINAKQNLANKEVPLPVRNITSSDITHPVDDEFISFLLEPGADGKKTINSSGAYIYSFDIKQPAFEQTSYMRLHHSSDIMKADPKQYIRGLSKEAYALLQKKDFNEDGLIFFGNDMRPGLGLYLIHKLREIPYKDREKILSMKSEKEIVKVINGMLRAEIRTPRHFFSKDYTTGLADGRGGFLTPEKTDNKRYMASKVKNDYKALIHGSENIKNNPKIVLSAVKQDGKAIMLASDNLKDNKDIIQAAVKATGKSLELVPDKYKDDKNVVLAAVRQAGGALEFASERLKNDRDVVLAAVKKDGDALRYASERLRDDKDITLTAVQSKGYILSHASARLKDDKDIVLAAVQSYGYSMQYVSERLKDDEDVVIAAIGKTGSALEHISDRFKDEKDIVLKAVQNDGYALKFASERLKDDKQIVLNSVNNYGPALEYASDRLKDDKFVVMEAVSHSGHALKYASERMRDNNSVVSIAMKNDSNASRYASERIIELLRKDVTYEFV
ncbi:DUF4116 domain-containing protein [Salmonella enterica subsp. enterica serovar Reading]|nr:DUF4116 domain-containing protein [Salmonella enterica subsp. enterica serovar Reading]EIQ4603366.1 DUF4116 domain-containing protein [Salmonella enterica subsp. enterica serovar Reading]